MIYEEEKAGLAMQHILYYFQVTWMKLYSKRIARSFLYINFGHNFSFFPAMISMNNEDSSANFPDNLHFTHWVAQYVKYTKHLVHNTHGTHF